MMRWTIILLFTMSALFVGYGVVNLLLLRQAEQFTTVQQTASSIISLPLVTVLPTDSVLSPQWFNQYHTYAAERATQLRGIANQLTLPLPPTHLVALDTQLGNRVLITWAQPLGQYYDGVEIARSKDSTMQKQTLVSDTALPATGQWFDTTVDNNQIYYYRLRSYRVSSDQTMTYSDWSEIITVIPTDRTPPAPPLLIAVGSLVEGEDTGLLVSWQLSMSSDVVGYSVYRSTTPGSLGDQILQTDDATITSARDTTVVAGVPYYYAVTAIDASGNESATTVSIGTFGNTAPFITTTSNGS